MSLFRARRFSSSVLVIRLLLCAAAVVAFGALAGTAVAATGSSGWFSQNPLSYGSQGNYLKAVDFVDTTHGWAVGGGGAILATNDGGITWTQQATGGFGTSAISFLDASHGWAVGLGGIILATTDGGATWTQQDSGTTASLAGVDFPDASRGWAVGLGGTILATTDGGATWTQQDSVTTGSLTSVDFPDASHGWAVGASGTILATTDGGATWSAQTSGTTLPLTSVSFPDASHGWAVGWAGSPEFCGVVLATADGGATWTQQASALTDYIPRSPGLTGVSFPDPSHGWVVGSGSGASGILVTADGGATWSYQSSGQYQKLYSVCFVDASHGWVTGGHGSTTPHPDPHSIVLATSDGGATWTQQNPGLLRSVCFPDASHGWAVGDSGAILATSDGGAIWSEQNSGTTVNLRGVSSPDTSHGWAVGYTYDSQTYTYTSVILGTSDGGVTWTQQYLGTTYTFYSPGLLSVSFPDASHGWAVGDLGTIVATTDGGATWTQQDSGTTGSLDSVSFPDASHGWAVGAGGILATADGGATWTQQATGAFTSVSFPDASHGWAVGDDNRILATSDGGATWTQKYPANNGWRLTSISFPDASHGWAVGHNTILATSDGGATWTQQVFGVVFTMYSCGLTSVSFPDAGHGWAVGDLGTIVATTTGGWDTTPPTTTASTSPPGWTNGAVQVALAAADSGGSGVAATYYQIGSLSSPILIYSAPFTVTDAVPISYWSTDNAGNIESANTLTPQIDTAPPTTTDDADAAWHNTRVTVTFIATDPNMPDASDVAYTEYSLDGGTTWTQGTSVTILAPADHSEDGVQAILYHSTDNVGNKEELNSCTVKIDTTPPVIRVAYLGFPHHRHHPGWTTRRSSAARGHQNDWSAWSRSHHGSQLRLTYRIDDNLSPTVAVAIELVGYRGTILQTVSLGQRPTGVLLTYRLPSKLPHGFSRLRLSATDLAGNTHSKLAGYRPFMHH